MRIDKFLWCVRVFKTRALAASACEQGKVLINQQPAKPSRIVQPQQSIQVKKNFITYQFYTLELPKSRVGAKLVPQYVVDQTPAEELAKLQSLRQSYYAEKPNKKERRAWQAFTENAEIIDWDEEEEDSL